jgi:hypothetical protein
LSAKGQTRRKAGTQSHGSHEDSRVTERKETLLRPGRKSGVARALVTLLAAGALAAGTYAFTASNTVDATQAGDGNAAVTGYTVTNVHYTRSATDPTLLDSYSFDLNGPATVVDAKPVSAQASYDSCSNTSANSWSCPAASGTTMLSLNNLRVIASE